MDTDMTDTANAVAEGADAGPFRPAITRAQAAAMRQAEREGVPFHCHRTGFEARVRMLSLADATLLAGIPPALQQQLTESLAGANRQQPGRSFADLLRTVQEDEALANAFCIAGFVSPRLVLTEDELDGTDDCWLVTDLHIEERKRYMGLVMGTEREEMARVARFLRARLAGDAVARSVPVAAAAQRPAGDGGGGVRAEDPAGLRSRGGRVRQPVRRDPAGDGRATGPGPQGTEADDPGAEVVGA